MMKLTIIFIAILSNIYVNNSIQDKTIVVLYDRVKIDKVDIHLKDLAKINGPYKEKLENILIVKNVKRSNLVLDKKQVYYCLCMATDQPFTLTGSDKVIIEYPSRGDVTIRFGEKLTATYLNHNLYVSVNVQALQSASIGEKIKVRNIDTGKIMTGVLIDSTTVVIE
ncbi:MAG: flagella basal body P-ring formation protein FlgA [Thermogemmata sp.]|nr:flagella basal body P-ring formation protein FlgA [Thermogemmata sp.]